MSSVPKCASSIVGAFVLISTQEGDKFMRLPEVYVKGNNVPTKLTQRWTILLTFRVDKIPQSSR